MADLPKWKPLYARPPGAIVEMVGTLVACVFFVPALVFLFLFCGGLALMGVGLDMMRRNP